MSRAAAPPNPDPVPAPTDAPAPRTADASPRVGAGPRLFALFLAAACLGVLVVAATLRPDARGVGTHQQLGLPPCGWMAAMNLPCPTCGMTTAFSYAAHARPLEALRAQPAGLLGAVLCSVLFWGSLHVAVFGSRLGRLVDRALAPRPLWISGGVFLAAWAYKIGQVRGLW